MIPKKVSHVLRRGRLPGEWATALKAVRMFCLLCVGGREEVKFCCAQTCWFYPLRMGWYPNSNQAEKFMAGGGDLLNVSPEQANSILEGQTRTKTRKSDNTSSRRKKRICEACKRISAISPHHLIPRSEGGGSHPENLLHLCSQCHNILEVACSENPILRNKIAALAFLDEMLNEIDKGEYEEDKVRTDVPDWIKRVYASAKIAGDTIDRPPDNWTITKEAVDKYRKAHGLSPTSKVVQVELNRRESEIEQKNLSGVHP